MQAKKRNNVRAVINAEGRKEVLAGIEYAVFPVVMVVEKVMNGLMYPADALELVPATWDGSPVVWPAHPSDNDEPWISANSPEQFDKNVVGFLFNSSTDKNDAGKVRLKSEVWIDAARAAEQGHADLMPALESDEPVEVSIGLQYLDDETPGTFDGEEFTASITIMWPDHLAILRDEEGACSVDAGCGTGVNSVNTAGNNTAGNAKQPESVNNCDCNGACTADANAPAINKINGDEKLPATQNNKSRFAKILESFTGKAELTDAEKRQIVNVKVRALLEALEAATMKTLAEDEYAWVRDADTDANKYWYETGGVTYERMFEMDANGQVTIGDSPVEVVGDTVWRPVANSKEVDMTDATAATGAADNKDTVQISKADNEQFQAWKAEQNAALDELRKKVINAASNHMTVDQVANMDKATLEALLAALVAKEEKEGDMKKGNEEDKDEGDMKDGAESEANSDADAAGNEAEGAEGADNSADQVPAADFSGKGGSTPTTNAGKNSPPAILNRDFFANKEAK